MFFARPFNPVFGYSKPIPELSDRAWQEYLNACQLMATGAGMSRTSIRSGGGNPWKPFERDDSAAPTVARSSTHPFLEPSFIRALVEAGLSREEACILFPQSTGRRVYVHGGSSGQDRPSTEITAARYRSATQARNQIWPGHAFVCKDEPFGKPADRFPRMITEYAFADESSCIWRHQR